MRDYKTPLQKAYYTAVKAALLSDGIGVYEGEEPDNITDSLYVVLSDIIGTDESTKSSHDISCTIQVSLHGHSDKYYNSSAINAAAGKILEAVKDLPASVLDMSGDQIQMLSLRLQTDRTDRLGELGAKKFLTRTLIFEQKLIIN